MSPMLATCLTQFFLLKLIALIILGDNTKNVASDYVILYTFHVLLGILKVAVNMFRSLKISARNDNVSTSSCNKLSFQQEYETAKYEVV